MKKLLLLLFFLFVIQCFIPSFCNDTSDIIKEQEKTIGISEFIKEAEIYTKETFDDIDLKSIYKNALTGKLETKNIGNRTS